MSDTDLLEQLIEEDFGYKQGDKYGKAVEHDSLVVDREKGIFYWNSEGIVGGLMTYLTKVRGLSVDSAKDFIKFNSRLGDTFVHIVKPDTEVVAYPELVNIFWENGRNNREYWYYRNLTDSTIDRFQLGFYNGWYTLPIFLDGTFRNFQLRQDVPAKKIRPWYRGVGALLFNADLLKLTNEIFITEGPVDAILLNQMGINAISHTAGAEGWDDNWFRYFMRQKSIYVIYDNDKAGKTGAKKVAEKLGLNRTKIFTFDGFPEKYDSVDCIRDGYTPEEYLEIVKKGLRYAFQV